MEEIAENIGRSLEYCAIEEGVQMRDSAANNDLSGTWTGEYYRTANSEKLCGQEPPSCMTITFRELVVTVLNRC